MMNERMELLSPSSLRPPAGSYSHGVVAAGLVHVAGTVGVDADGHVAPDIETQTLQTIDNIVAILAKAGAGLHDVISATVYLTDMAEYGAFASAWATRFGPHRPARATVRADLVHPALKIEIQAVALAPSQ